MIKRLTSDKGLCPDCDEAFAGISALLDVLEVTKDGVHDLVYKEQLIEPKSTCPWCNSETTEAYSEHRDDQWY